tara:strand:- start:381 stop:506 length:126 start_codon:yes stop_codon:yes gene_type:complete
MVCSKWALHEEEEEEEGTDEGTDEEDMTKAAPPTIDDSRER